MDAMIMNGDTYAVGAVCDLRRVKNAIGDLPQCAFASDLS